MSAPETSDVPQPDPQATATVVDDPSEGSEILRSHNSQQCPYKKPTETTIQSPSFTDFDAVPHTPLSLYSNGARMMGQANYSGNLSAQNTETLAPDVMFNFHNAFAGSAFPQPNSVGPSGMSPQQKYIGSLPSWECYDVSPYNSHEGYQMISPVCTGSSRHGFMMPQSVRASGNSHYSDHMNWRTASSMAGSMSARHAATVQYLNVNPDVRVASPNDKDIEPPGFPPMPEQSGSQAEKQTDRSGSIDMAAQVDPNSNGGDAVHRADSKTILPVFDHSTVPYWASMGTPAMGMHQYDWSDSIMPPHGPNWSTRSSFPVNHTGFYPMSSANNGQLSATHMGANYASPFVAGSTDPMFFMGAHSPSDGANQVPMEEAPGFPSSVRGAASFSPWKNLNNLPDCQPLEGRSVSRTGADGRSTTGVTAGGLASVALSLDLSPGQDCDGMLDMPSTPLPVGSDHSDGRMTVSTAQSCSLQPTGPSKSMGSMQHPHDCRPCAFYWTKGCINGQDCRFCHEWHPPKKKKPMKEQKNLMIIARPDGKIEFMRCTVHEAMRVL